MRAGQVRGGMMRESKEQISSLAWLVQRRWLACLSVSLIVAWSSFPLPAYTRAPAPDTTMAACAPTQSTFVGDGVNGTLGEVYRVAKFNTVGSCDWTVPTDVSSVDVLVVGGGGGGGGFEWAGGGGGGGVLYGQGISVTPSSVISISVGAGGAGGANVVGETGRGSNGGTSAFGSVVAPGGGGGGGKGWSNAYSGAGSSGGSGGGTGEHGDNTLWRGDLVYRITKPARDGSGGIQYATDNRNDSFGAINRVTYRMQLDLDSTTFHAEATFDAWKSGLTAPELRVPDLTSGDGFAVQEVVKNMIIDSNMPASDTYKTTGVTTSGLAGTLFTGYLEIWPWNYGRTSTSGSDSDGDIRPLGNDNKYDFNDSFTVGSGDHGSFQVHNVNAGSEQTVLAWNKHGGGLPEIGFGNYTGSANEPDWTFAADPESLVPSENSTNNWSLEIRVNKDQFQSLGGGASSITTPSGWSSFGHAGGAVHGVASQAGSGGGGAGGAGQDVPRTSQKTIDGVSQPRVAGNGGAGRAFNITGASVTYAGGGGGSTVNQDGAQCASGGAGGGGAGGCSSAGTVGTDGLGGGGGGSQGLGASGGDGVVIVRYATSSELIIKDGGDTGTSGSGWSTSGTNPVNISVIGQATIAPSVIEGYLATGADVVIDVSSLQSADRIVVEDSIVGANTAQGTLTLRADEIIVDADINASAGNGTIVLEGNKKIEPSFASADAIHNLSSGSGDITLITDNLKQATGSQFEIQTTGHLTVQPKTTDWSGYGGQFDLNGTYDALSDTFTASNASDSGALKVVNLSGLTGLTLGKAGMNVGIRAYTPWSINGDLTLAGNFLRIDGDITAGPGHVLLNATNGAVETTSANVTIGGSAQTGNIRLLSDQITLTNSPTIQTSGDVIIESVSSSFSSTPDVSGLTIQGNASANPSSVRIGKSGNNQDIAIGKITSAGPITVYAKNITISDNLTSTASGADLLLKGTGKITLAANKNLQTNNGDIVLWSNSAGGTSGGITINDNAGINSANGSTSQSTGGGVIVLGGGNANETLASGTVAPTGASNGTGNTMSGIHLGASSGDSDSRIYSGGGDVSLNGVSTSADKWGVQWDDNGLIDAGNGSISITGSSADWHGIELGAYNGSFTLKAAGGVTIDGTTTASGGYRGFQGIDGEIVVAGAGAIDVIGTAANASQGIFFQGEALAESGNINFDGGTKGILLENATIGQKASTEVSASSSDIRLMGDAITVNTSGTIETSGTLTIKPSSTSFSGALTYPVNNLTVASGLTALTLGKEFNTANITISSAQTIGGPISIYGGAIAINATTTATGSDINLYASGAVSQTAALTANRLSLNGTGNFTLQNSSNNVNVIAGGDGTTRLGNVAYRDANALEIGSINPSGIFSSGTVLIETETGDLTLSQSINTTSPSDNAIVLNAGRTASVGSKAGGDIIVSGSPTLSFGTSGGAKLFSGLESQSTGLTTLAGGDANARRGFDENSDLSGENLVDDQTYAIYRVAEGTGNLTVVDSGGHAINTTWEVVNGVIQTIGSSADIDASEIETRLASGDLTVSAGNITVNDHITSNSTHRLTLKAVDDITINASKTLQTNNGDLIVWADSDNDGAGAIEVADDVTINTINGVTTPGLSGGGHIVLAGGTDNGSNGGVASDGIPDGHAASTTGNGIKLGTGNTSHTQMYSGGGDIIIRGASTANDVDNPTNVGVNHAGRWTANSGEGAIVVSGESANFYGINFVLPLNNVTTGDKHLSLISDKATGDAITITGVTAANDYGVVFNYENPKEILATGGGNITIAGSGGGSYGVFFQNQDILATSGTITIDGNKGILTVPTGVRFGAKDGSSITSSSSDVVISADVFQFDTPTSGFESEIDTTGSVTIEPSSASFSSLLTYPFTNLTVGPSITGLRLGKAGNSRDLTLSGSDISVAGPISIYGGFVNINANLTSTDTGDIFIKSLSNNNPSVDLQSGKTITKTSGTGTLTMQAQGRVENNGAITASGSGQLNVVLWSDFNNTNNDGGVTQSGSIATNGGHVWMGGSSSDGGTLTWNGLTVGDGPSIGTGSYNNNALDFYGSVTTSGGDFFAWAGDTSVSQGIDGIASGPSHVINAGSGEVTLVTDTVFSGPVISTTGQINLVPNGGSYASALGWTTSTTSGNLEVTAGHYDGLRINSVANMGGLAIGSYSGLTDGNSDPVVLGNTSNVTLNSPLTITGPIEIHGGDIAINAATTATSNDVKLHATGAVSQSAAITANGLSLNGSGNFTLQNTSNDVNTIAGGSTSARLGAVSYFNADDVTIGTVNPTGIYSSGDVLIETATGNINLTEPINTTSTTNTTTGYAGAIVLNAGKSAGLGSAAGGDIIVSGNGAVTSGGINKLYSGSDEASTGLTTLAGQSNARDLVDETTTTFNPVLTGNATYALYRSGPLGEGDLTIVASGGAAKNSGWVYNNGVLATTQATVSVNASDVVTKLGSGNLTIEANNITVDAPVSWNNTNALTLQAIKNIVVGADDELISAGGNISLLAGQSIGLSQSATWANRSVINANGGNILIQAISGAFDVGRVVSLAFVEIKTSGTGTISITGDGTNSTRSAQSSWGVSFDGAASRSLIQSEHGAINIVGVGGGVSVNSRGIVADSRDFQVLSATGAITLRDQRPSTCTSCGYGGIYFNPSTNDGTGIVFGSDGTTVLSGASTESASTITIQADRFFTELGTSTVRTTGTMTLEPANAIFEASQTFPGALSLTSDVSGLTLGKAGNTAEITVNAATTIAGPITLYGDDISIQAALEATNDQISFIGAAADDIKGTVSNNAAGTITADELLIENIHNVSLRDHANISVDKFASQGGHRILVTNNAQLELGSVGSVSGISASEFVVIETTTGDLTITEPVTSSLSSGTSIILNAGKDKSVGDDTGGDIIVSGDGAINIEPGAVAKLYSGSPANSNGLAPEADVALVFYDETDQPPSSSFAAGNAYAIYRETSPSQLSIETQPAITAASGVAFATQPKVAIEDAFGNVIRTDTTSKIQAQIFSGDNGTLLGTQEVTVTNGEATFSDLALLGPVGGTYRLRFTSLGLFAVASDNITITDPGPVDLTVSTITADPVGNLTADGTETSVLAVTVTDTYGNPIPGESVVLTLNDDTGRTLGANTGTTNAIGQIATTLASTVAGTTTVSAYLNSEASANLIGSVGVGFLAGEPAKLQMISGNGQTGEVAQALANPLNVRVRDAQDNIVEGASVVFAGDGTTTPSSGVAVSDATGLAQITWTLGELAGTQTLTATLAGSDPAVTVSFVATADPGPPAQFGVVPASPKQLTTIPFALDVVLQDAYGNTTVADSNLTVALTDNNTSFVASLPGANDGDLEIDQTPGAISQTLTAGQDTISLPAVVYSGLSAPDVETPDIEIIATATLNSQTLTGQALISARDIKLSMTAAPSEITADGIESSLLTTTLLDLQDAAVPNQAVRFENTAGVLIDATTLQPLPDPVVIQGDANGQAQVRLRAGTVMQTAKVTAISRGADPASVNIELKAGAADIATSLVTANPTSIVANGVAESIITVQLVDANGNLTDRLPTGQALTLASSNGTLQGSLSDEGNGLYTQRLKAPTAVGSSDLTASIGSTAITDQATVNFVADVPSQIQIVGGNNQQATVDKALANAITVQVTDAQGNAISNTDINFQGSGSTTPADGVVTTDAQGLASINWRLGTTRGVQTLTATLVSDPLIQAEVQATAQADVASSIRITEQPVAEVNAALLKTQPAVELLDQFGNRVVQDNQTSISAALLSGSSLALSGTTTATASNGLITFTDLIVTGPLNTADRIRFSGPGLAAAVSDPIALTQAGVMDVTASTLTATPQGNLIANGQSASTLLVQAVDVSGNAVVGETIVFSASGGRLSATQGQTNAQGQLSIQLTSTEAGAVSVSAYRLSVASANLVGQTTLGFVSDAPAKLEIISGNNQQAVVGTQLTQPLKVRVLDAGNNTVANAAVVFVGAGSTVPADGVVISDANGLAEVSWTLPEKAGTAVMQAQLAGTTPLVAQSFTATAQAGEPSKLLVRVNDPRQLTTIPFDVLVTLADRFGNVVTDDEALEIQLVATNQSAAAQVPDAREGDLYRAGLTNNVVTAALPSGQASVVVEDVIYDGLSAPSLENPDVAVQAIVAGKNIAGQTVIAARDVKLDGEAAPAEIVADGQSTTRITFTLSDLDGNPIPNQAVSIDNTQGTLLSTQQQVLTVPAVLVTDANGELLVDLRASEVITEAVVTGRRQGASPEPVSVVFTKPRDATAVNELIGFDPDSDDPDVSNPPTLDDYTDAGVDKAKEENVDAYNSAIGNLDLTIEEIEKMVESYNQLLEEAGTGTATLTEEDFANLGITITDPVQLSLLNSIIGLLDAETLKDHDVLLEIAAVVEKLMAWVQGQQVSPALTLADLELIGITGVDPETLPVALAALFDHPDGLLAIPSIGAVQALIDAALIDEAAGDLIGFDPDSEDPTVSAAPTLESYIDAGITEAKEANVAAYNAALSNLDLTPEGIAEMVNAYNALLEQASQGDVQLTSDEFAALGIDVTDAQSLALLNSILSSKSPNALMDHDALLAMAQAMQALLAWMQGLSTSHGLTLADLELLGITGINADEFEASMALLANHPDVGSVDSLALLQGLVDGALSELRALPVPVNPSWAIGLLIALMWWLGLSRSMRSRVSG